jgi:hypothetical protein
LQLVISFDSWEMFFQFPVEYCRDPKEVKTCAMLANDCIRTMLICCTISKNA